jgi:H/ACA ribonucleoprotein complex subunit 4
MHLHKKVEEEKIKEIFKEFTGKIRQKPPIKSSVRRIERTREIYYFDILEIQDQDVLFKVGCEAGTYIRKLCHQIGERLGCGAHMSELRRTKAGPFTEKTLFTLQDLQDAFYYYKKEGKEKYLKKIIQPVENGIKHLSKIWVSDTTVESLCHGSDLKVPGISKLNDEINKNDTVAILTLKEELIALGIAKLDSEEILKKDKGVAVKTERVFMKPGTYKIE